MGEEGGTGREGCAGEEEVMMGDDELGVLRERGAPTRLLMWWVYFIPVLKKKRGERRWWNLD